VSLSIAIRTCISPSAYETVLIKNTGVSVSLVSFTPCCPAHCNFQSNFVSVSSACANKVSQLVSQSANK